MSFSVIIVRNSDGERVVHTEQGEWDEVAEYRWTEGNESCDCNRAALFADARNEEDPSPSCVCGQVPAVCKCPRAPCGDTRFSVILPLGESFRLSDRAVRNARDHGFKQAEDSDL